MNKETTEQPQVQEEVQEQVAAPTPPPIRQKRIERRGGATVPLTHRYPEVRGGVCEWCGIKDANQPSEVQYLLCDHFKHIGQLQCSYCDASKDPVEVTKKHTLNVHDHPNNPDEVVVVCDSYECAQKHLNRFKISA